MADNITVLDSTGTSKNWATSEGSDSQHRQHVVPTDDDGTKVIGTTADAAKTTDTTGTVIGFLRGIVAWFARLGSLDGAAFTAGSSYVWPGLAGVYQSTVGTLTAGQRGLARLTERRAVVTAGDTITATKTYAFSDVTTVANSLLVAQTGLSRDELRKFKEWQVSIYSTLDAVATVAIYAKNLARGEYFAPGNAQNRIYSVTGVVAAGGYLVLSPHEAGTGVVDWAVVPALKGIFGDMDVQITSAAATTGSIVVAWEGRA